MSSPSLSTPSNEARALMAQYKRDAIEAQIAGDVIKAQSARKSFRFVASMDSTPRERLLIELFGYSEHVFAWQRYQRQVGKSLVRGGRRSISHSQPPSQATPAQAEHQEDDRGGRAKRQDCHEHHHTRWRDAAIWRGRANRGKQSVACRDRRQGHQAMTRLHRLRYVQAFVDRDTGAVFRYFRRPGYPRVRLPGLPGSAEFNRAYEAALEGPKLAVGVGRSKPGSLSVAIAGYYTSLEFRSLAAGTQTARRAILERFRAAHGDKPIVLLPPKFIAHVLSTMKPFAARNWLKAIRHLMQFRVAQEMCATDPTQGIKLPRAKSDGIHYVDRGRHLDVRGTSCDRYKAPARARALALHGSTARRRAAHGASAHSRRCDHRAPGQDRDHARDPGAYRFARHPRCHAGRTPDVCRWPTRQSVHAECVPKWFRDQCDAAGLPRQCSAHGLRKAACRRLAEAGCSANEIAAISGHASLREVERYTRAVDQERMARNAMARTKDELRTVKFREV